MKTATEQDIRKEQRKRFQFDATASDDEMEDELDDNLGEISDMTKRLKALGSAMGEELDKQNERIGRIGEKTDNLDGRLYRNTQKVRSCTFPPPSSPLTRRTIAQQDQVGCHWQILPRSFVEYGVSYTWVIGQSSIRQCNGRYICIHKFRAMNRLIILIMTSFSSRPPLCSSCR